MGTEAGGEEEEERTTVTVDADGGSSPFDRGGRRRICIYSDQKMNGAQTKTNQWEGRVPAAC